MGAIQSAMDAGYTQECLGTGFEFVPACAQGAFEGVLQGEVGADVGCELEEVFYGPA